MNAGFSEFLAAQPEDRRDAFLGAARRLGTPEQNIEKDFWVTWTLDVLFNGLPQGHPRLLFKGGTSLSKGYGLISRFSEDIDITVFRSDIGEEADFQQLEALSKKARAKRLDAIKTACQGYINGKLRVELDALGKKTMEAAGKDPTSLRVVLDEADQDRQTLLIYYPSAVHKS